MSEASRRTQKCSPRFASRSRQAPSHSCPFIINLIEYSSMETESKPLVAVHVSFGSHGKEAKQYLPQLKDSISRFFEPPPTRNIFLVEGATTTTNSPRQIRELYQITGSFLDAWIWFHKFSINQQPNPEALAEEREFRLSGAVLQPQEGEDEMATMSRWSTYFNTHLMKTLDDFKNDSSYSFELDTETHPQVEAISIDRTIRQSQQKHYLAAQALIDEGLKPTLSLYTQSARLLATTNFIRNRRYIERLIDYTNEAQKRNQPTRILVRVGLTHDLLLELISNESRLAKVAIAESYDMEDRLIDHHWRLVYNLQRSRSYTPSEDELLRGLLTNKIMGKLMNMTEIKKLKAVIYICDNSTPEEITHLLNSLRGVEPLKYHANLNTFIRSKLQEGSESLGDLVTEAIPHLRLDLRGISI